MALDLNLAGGVTNAKAEVDSVTKQLLILPGVGQTPAGVFQPEAVGGIRIYGESDSGTVTGAARLIPAEVSDNYRQRVALDTLRLGQTFNATAQNTANWKHLFTTMTMTAAAGFVLCNANSTGTASTGCSLQSWRYFPLFGSSGMYVEFTFNITNQPAANQMFQCGYGIPTATASPTDGVFFRLTNAGMIAVLAYNGVETPSGVLMDSSSYSTSQNYKLAISSNERTTTFWQDDVELVTIPTPSGNAQSFMTDSLPLFFQQLNTGTVSGTQMQCKIGAVTESQTEFATNMPWAHQMASFGITPYQGQDGGTMGSTALYTNNLAAGAGVALTNTTAAAGSGFGGQFSVQPTLTAGTDGILCSVQNPIGGVNQTPRMIVLTGINIIGVVTTALTGGPVICAYSLAYGHTAVSMATAETASFANNTTKAPRRIPLGLDVFGATSPVGTIGYGVNIDFSGGPIVVNPGEFLAVCLKNLGTVTSAGVICFHVTPIGYSL